jgi:hypothetical protein
MVFLVAVGLGAMIPAAPGSLGTYQFLAVASLAIFSVPNSTAFSL